MPDSDIRTIVTPRSRRYQITEPGAGTLANMNHPSTAHVDMTYSRRQVLSGATYGVGATLLFGRPLADVRPSPSAQRHSEVTAHASASGERPPASFDAMTLGAQGQPRAVCRGRAGVMVVGVDPDGDPVSWLNEGQAHWLERTLRRPAKGEPEVWGVATHGGRYVAVGSIQQQHAEPVVGGAMVDPADSSVNVTYTSSRRLPTVWWTRDNSGWKGRTLDEVGVRHAQLIAVSCNSDRLVAVGSTLDADGVAADEALVMMSADDGDTWDRGEIAPGDAASSEGTFTGVTQSDGHWLATSTDIAGGAVWTSPDGRRWSTLAASARRFRGITLQGIGVRRERVYVAGTALTDQTPCYFVSSDWGRTWRSLRPAPTVLSGDDTTVTDLTVMSDEVVVVGTRDDVPVIEGGAPDAAN